MNNQDWSPQVARAMHEFSQAAPLPPTLDDSQRPRSTRRPLTAAGPHSRLPGIAGAVVLVALLTAGLAVWNSSRSPSVAPATSAPTSELSSSFRGVDLDTSLPLVGRGWLDRTEFSLDRRTNERLYDVWQAAIVNCMRERGLDYKPVPYPENGSYEDQVSPLDREYAAVMGYHPLSAEPIDPNIATEAIVTAAGQCANEVNPSTFGALGNYFAHADKLRNDLANTTDGFEADNASRLVKQAWSLCMAKAGYDFETRSDAIVQYQETFTISSDEIATRLADLECDIKVGYTQTQHDWEAPRVANWEAANRDAIQTAMAERAELLERLSALETELLGSPRSASTPPPTAPEPVSDTTSLTNPTLFDSGASLIVWVNSQAIPEQVDLIRNAILQSGVVTPDGLQYLDAAASLAEAQRVLTADPESLALLNASNISTMFLLFPADVSTFDTELWRSELLALPMVVDVYAPTDDAPYLSPGRSTSTNTAG